MSAWRASDGLAAALQSVAPVAALLTHDIEQLDDPAARTAVCSSAPTM